MSDENVVSRYKGPDTSDKRDDECWVEYWDRKRRERHGEDCKCPLCELVRIRPDLALSHGWCPHTYKDNPEIVQ